MWGSRSDSGPRARRWSKARGGWSDCSTRMAYPNARIVGSQYLANRDTKTLTATWTVGTGPLARFGDLQVNGLKDVNPEYVHRIRRLEARHSVRYSRDRACSDHVVEYPAVRDDFAASRGCAGRERGRPVTFEVSEGRPGRWAWASIIPPTRWDRAARCRGSTGTCSAAPKAFVSGSRDRKSSSGRMPISGSRPSWTSVSRLSSTCVLNATIPTLTRARPGAVYGNRAPVPRTLEHHRRARRSSTPIFSGAQAKNKENGFSRRSANKARL